MDTSTRPLALIFDIDGTLVDSNYLHVEAWTRTFEEIGAPVAGWRVHRSIGLDSAKLLDALLGDRVDELSERATERHSELHQELSTRLRSFEGAQELIAHLNEAGVRVVLATSAPQKEFEKLQQVLDLDDNHYTATTADDVETAKPEPDVVEAALKLADVEADRAVMVGDTKWDAVAAARAGVRSIGVLSGGVGADELREGGAMAVFDDVAAILAAVREGGLEEIFGAELVASAHS